MCDALHLPGDCCPTADGIVLDCCGGAGSNGDPSDEWTALAYAAHSDNITVSAIFRNSGRSY